MVVLNSLSFCLSVKLLISLSILNEIFPGYSNLGCRFFPLIPLNISCHSIQACTASAEKSGDSLMGITVHIIIVFFFFLVAYKIFS